MLRLTNTLTGQKETFQPLNPPRVALYVCGVTVYDDCHIGHARGAVVFDVLRRTLEHQGFSVTHVRNITDVDDKIIDRARTWGLTPLDFEARVQEVAHRYTQGFQSDFSRLGLLAPHQEPKATEYIPQMIGFIRLLVERGLAYPGSDGVYFSVQEFARRYPYGKLSHQKLDQMQEGARVEAGEGKKEPLDFALWKKAKPDEPAWESPWGPGRPGWHIECSTMSTALLGDTFDIHGGGQDLIFPHHENERAQSLGAGKPFARFWLHNGLLTVNGQKMSKSLGNIIRIRDVLEKHSADVLRMFFLSAHYRSPQDFTWERLEESAHAYERLVAFLSHSEAAGKERTPQEVREAEKKFHEAMEDDLNTPRALAALYDWVAHPGQAAGQKVRELGRTLGFFQAGEGAVEPEAQKLVGQRDEARRKKDFQAADTIRRKLIEMGYVVEDTAGKTVVRRRR